MNENIDIGKAGQLVNKREFGDGLPLVVLLEKANSNISCEKNIIRILRRLFFLRHVALVCVDGAASKLQPELFRIFPKHRRFNRVVTAKLVLEGYLTGVEYWLTNDEPSVLPYGVEDLNSYKRMREDSLVLLQDGQKWKSRLKQVLDDLLDPPGVDVSADLIAFVKATPYAEVGGDVVNTPLQNQIETLHDYAVRCQIDFRNTPTLAGGLSTVLLAMLSGQQLAIDGLVSEMDSIRIAVLECLATNERSREYVSLRRRLVLAAKIVAGECTVGDATEAAIRRWDTLELVKSLSRFLPGTTISRESASLQDVLRRGIDFYRVLKARSGFIAENTIELMRELKQDTAVLLITGAVRHGVEDGLAARGVSYYVIRPAMVVSDNDERRYIKMILGSHDVTGQVPNDEASAEHKAFVAEMDEDLAQLLQEINYGFTPEQKACFERYNYQLAAYAFVLQGITEASRRWDEQRSESSVHGNDVCGDHFTGQHLCRVLIDLAIAFYESDAYATLEGWGIRETVDFGRIVFALAEARLVSKTDRDCLDDFRFASDLRSLIAAIHNTEAPNPRAQLETDLDTAMKRFVK
jgi:uncharacterized repeat protein (TIGR04138 family)